VSVDSLRRLHAKSELGTRIVSALGTALALAVGRVVVNTIRLSTESPREEIVVVKIVGGTDCFVRRPFLYTGFWFGLFGGIFAVVLVEVALWWIDSPIAQLVSLYESPYVVSGLHAAAALTLPMFAGLLGLAGAWLAFSRHLKDIEPQAFWSVRRQGLYIQTVLAVSDQFIFDALLACPLTRYSHNTDFVSERTGPERSR